MKKRKTVPLRDTSNLTMIGNYKLIQIVRDSILAGESKSEIIEKISNQFNIKDNELLQKLYTNGLEYYQLRAITEIDRDIIITEHLLKYEKIYNFFHDLDIKHLKHVPLQAKERLLGYHNDINILEITQENTIETTNIRYNSSKLTEVERKRFEELMSKVKKK